MLSFPSHSYTGFGELESYWGMVPSTDEVYVLRFWLVDTFMNLSTPYDPLRLVSVVGHLLPSGYNVRGIAIQEDDLADANAALLELDELSVQHSVHADIILTHAHGLQLVGYFRDGEDFTELMNRSDSEFHQQWPDARVVGAAKWYELTGPERVLVDWRISPVLWDYRLNSIGGQGGPTSAFVRGDGVWIGTADQPLRQLPPTEVKPIPAPPNGGGASVPPPPASARPDASFWMLVGAAGIATYFVFRNRKDKGVLR